MRVQSHGDVGWSPDSWRTNPPYVGSSPSRSPLILPRPPSQPPTFPTFLVLPEQRCSCPRLRRHSWTSTHTAHSAQKCHQSWNAEDVEFSHAFPRHSHTCIYIMGRENEEGDCRAGNAGPVNQDVWGMSHAARRPHLTYIGARWAEARWWAGHFAHRVNIRRSPLSLGVSPDQFVNTSFFRYLPCLSNSRLYRLFLFNFLNATTFYIYSSPSLLSHNFSSARLLELACLSQHGGNCSIVVNKLIDIYLYKSRSACVLCVPKFSNHWIYSAHPWPFSAHTAAFFSGPSRATFRTS